MVITSATSDQLGHVEYVWLCFDSKNAEYPVYIYIALYSYIYIYILLAYYWPWRKGKGMRTPGSNPADFGGFPTYAGDQWVSQNDI
jgi:hypothetical protein